MPSTEVEDATNGKEKDRDVERKQMATQAEAGPSSQATAQGGLQKPPRAVIGRTVFVRGLGSDVSKQQLQARMESFGAVKACR